ncbi:putative bifunctional diguanylate cyclase/phosphodiesterase [Pseudoalteromonas atlantica]|uniref:putative bifunctional diguanylate cyclase/phosphodiesterase n=1 Tax=Pseudoalteromonas atlantica TaxID=288 RepID=UPI000BBC35E5|nr:bifunctional diguanylate cyclase/phosphodiesterase [Pseudoalteromonas atlantica]
MDNFFIFILIVGALLLTLSIVPTIKICKKTNRVSWILLLALIFSFIVGYWYVLYYFVNNDIAGFIAMSVSLILFGGGAFVYLVIQLSYKSILKIDRFAKRQRTLAENDSLTGLPNRKKFFQVLNKQVKYEPSFYLMLIDLNRFKSINDSYGNKVGDMLLSIFSKTLSHNIVGIAKLYRLGGDEFALIVDNSANEAINLCIEAIKKSTKHPFHIYEHSLRVHVTVGITTFANHSSHANELLKQADLALHEAKDTQQLYVHYFEALSTRANELSNMTSRIKHAIKNHEFELYLQPIFDARADEVHGAEALIRWPQSDGSFISPEVFIGIAEQSGLILNISKWVLLETIKHLKELKAAGFIGSLHVNLSTKDLESPEFYEFVEELVKHDPTLSDAIIFEITECAMMTNLEAARTMMQKLNSRGFEFSVDDFGTGFSSLVLLRELPISQIKIDQSFIKDMLTQIADYAIVESTLFLATRLNCKVVAEGIEDNDLKQTLTLMDCDYLQGYYFSKPVNINEFIHNYANEEEYRII